MRLLVANHIRNANEALRANRLRTLLTILGITLGVACMTTIMALSYGATELITRQVDDLGGNIAVIRPGAPSLPISKKLFLPWPVNPLALAHSQSTTSRRCAAPMALCTLPR